ncbi:MAG: hypothetical protein JRI25_24180 [Deltaproteobacteria bacterium]|nr:hypothetical protein [Deltaproteobacteria bacterium]
MKTSLYRLPFLGALLVLGMGSDCGNKCDHEDATYEDGDEWIASNGDECECIEGEVDCVTPDPGCTHEGVDYDHGDSWTSSTGESCTCDAGEVLCMAPTLLRGVHLVPDLAAACDLDPDTAVTDMGAACLDLYVEDSTVPLNLDAGPFPFGASTAHTALPLTGTLNFHAVAYGETNIADNRLVSVAVTLEAGDTKTFTLYGLAGASAVSTDVSDSDVSAPATVGKARVTVFHGEISALSAAGLDIYIGATKVSEDLAYGAYSTSIEIDPATDTTVAIDTDNNPGAMEWGTAPVATAGITLAANEFHDLFLVLNPTYDNTDPTSPPLLILQYIDDAQEPTTLGIFAG